MTSNRRSFLKTAGMATAVASAVPIALSLPGGNPETVAAADRRSYAQGRFALELDGALAGIVPELSGGHPYGEVIEAESGGGLAKKHIGNVKYEEISFRAHSGMGEPLWTWISAMLAGKPVYKSGAVHNLDSSLPGSNMIEFEDALISAVTFPAMDGSSKETAYLDVVITPTLTRLKPGKPKSTVGPKQKSWLCSNFRLRLGDLPGGRVSKIDAFTIKQGVSEPGDGLTRTIEPTKLEYPNLSITLSEADGAPWFAYLDSFVVQGRNGPDAELQGSIEYLAPDLRTVLAQISLSGMGLFRMSHAGPSDSNASKSRMLQADLYANGIQFSGPRG